MPKRPLIIDTDTGCGFVHAAMLVAGCGLFDIKGACTVYGSTTAKRAAVHAAYLRDLCADYYPVVSGAEKPILVRRKNSMSPDDCSALEDTEGMYTFSPDPEERAWDFIYRTAVSLDGKAFNEQDLAGADLTKINIWSTTCGPCLREMPELAELEKSLPDNVNLITFCFDASANPESVREVLSEAGFEGITLTEGDGDLESLLLSIQYVPTSVFVDSNGNQVGQAIIGAPNDPVEYYTQAINDALDSLGKDQI